MDPFNGLGSTAVACARLGVDEFIGCDIDEQYLAEAVTRLESAGKPKMAKAGLRVREARAGKAG
jgi:DNA modification methylase